MQNITYVPLDETTNHFECSDLDLAATLIVLGCELLSVHHLNNNRSSFVFKEHENIPSAIDGYWSNQIQVPPLMFANARKNLKSRIYATR